MQRPNAHLHPIPYLQFPVMQLTQEMAKDTLWRASYNADNVSMGNASEMLCFDMGGVGG
jgi:hypothetical protein